MLDLQFVSQNSRFFENMLEHRFVFDLCQHMVLQPRARLVNVLKSDVDAFGFDLALSVVNRTAHVQMKTRVGKTSSYAISESLWSLPNAYVIWMIYDLDKLNPESYSLLDLSKSAAAQFPLAKRNGYRKVSLKRAVHSLTLPQIAGILFP